MRRIASYLFMVLAVIMTATGLHAQNLKLNTDMWNLQKAVENKNNELSSKKFVIMDQRFNQGVNLMYDPAIDSSFFVAMHQRMDSIRTHRPTVGLVLSGGGAKGSAHVGVIKYLEEVGIPVDLVVGTSMGGLVGGIYSLGYNAAQMDSLLMTMPWEKMMSDRLDREFIPYSEIRYKEKYLLSLPFHYDKKDIVDTSGVQYMVEQHQKIDVGASSTGEGLKDKLMSIIPFGLIYGRHVNDVIKGLSIGYHDSLRFENLPIPFACVATDLVSGKGKVWHSGSFADALRSTMSVPGIFAPVKRDGMVLVDGGMRDNYPTDLAKRLGSDIIIGVTLSSGYEGYKDINTIVDVVNTGVDMMGREAYELNVEVPDVTIRPDIKGYSMMSFDKESVAKLIKNGYEAAKEQAFALDSLKSVIGDNTLTLNSPPAMDTTKDSVYLRTIEFHGITPKEEVIIRKKAGLTESTWVSRADIERVENVLMGMGTFEYITYDLLNGENKGQVLRGGDNKEYDLVFSCKRGPTHRLGIGVRFDTEELVTAMLNVGLNVNKIRGSRFDINLKLSANPYLELKYSFDSPKAPTFNFDIFTRWMDMGILDFSRGNRLNLRYLHSNQKIYLSNIKWKYVDMRLGLENDIWHFPAGSPQLGGTVHTSYCEAHSWTDYFSLFLDAKTNTMDNGYFPTRGVDAGLSYQWAFARFPKHSLDEYENFHIFSAYIKGAVSAGDIFTFLPYGEVRVLLGNYLPLVAGNFLGGTMRGRYVESQIPFIGTNNLVSVGPYIGLVGMDFRFKVAKNHYLSAFVDYARDGANPKDWVANKLGWFGTAVEYSYNSIVGPMSLNIHWSNIRPTKNKVGFYANLGFVF